MMIKGNNQAISSHIIGDYKVTYKQLENQMKRLSTGKRVNQASDDAAGTAIISGFNKQVRGDSQARRNVKDAISMTRIAEGGLQSIESQLQRVRELVLQAQNGTYSVEDKLNIQIEVNQLLNSVNQISQKTNFNQVQLLNTDATPPGSGTTKPLDMVFVLDNTGSMSFAVSNINNNIDAFVSQLQTEGYDVQLGLVVYGDEYAGGSVAQKYPMTNDTTTFKSYVSGVSFGGGGDWAEAGLEAIMNPVNGALTYSFRPDSKKEFVMITDAPVHDNADGDGGDGISPYDIDNVVFDLASNGITMNIVSQISGITHTQLSKLNTGTDGLFMDITGDFGLELTGLGDKLISEGGTSGLGNVLIQSGYQNDNTYNMELVNTGIEALGIDAIDVTDPASIGKIDTALEEVVHARTRFGTYENVLQTKDDHLAASNIGAEGAKSRIEDLDMGLASSEFAKVKIIQQSNLSLLTQVNAMSENVMKLLN